MARKITRKNRPRVPVASTRHFRQAPRKVRYVADLIRGKNVDEAKRILTFCQRRAARQLLRLVESAEANADNLNVNELGEFDPERLYVHTILVDEGVTLKRFRPRAMGRAARIRKRTSHIRIELAQRP